ncbi:MAG TPA: acyltransferase, partial [Chroococcales cyanobacterium]
IIVWHHARDHWIPMQGFGEENSFKHLVTMFFVLSGFILTYRYTYVKDVGSSMHFYLARIARLWPMHVFCLFTLLTLLPEVFQIKGEWTPVFLCNFFMVQSWVPITKYYFSYNAPSWSSATLSFFDIAFPFLFIIGQRSKAVIVGVCAAIVLAMIYAANALHLSPDAPNLPSVHGLLYINPLARLLEFATGVAAALWFQNHHHKVKLSLWKATALEAVLIGVLWSVNVYAKHWKALSISVLTEPGSVWLYNSGVCFIPFAAFITVLAMERGLVAKFFSTNWMKVLGDMSFALYMLHGIWIAYFFTHFHEQYSLVPALFFFTSLVVSAHVMHCFVVQPMRKAFLKYGTMLLSLKWPSPSATRYIEKPKSPEKIRKRRISMAIEVAVAAVLIYIALPGLDPISQAQATALASQATVRDVSFDPWVKCTAASAQQKGDYVDVNTVWQAEKNQFVDFYLTVRAQDASGNVLKESRYQMDGRCQFVSANSCWQDNVRLYMEGASTPTKVTIQVTRGKRRDLTATAVTPGQADNGRLVLPVAR